MKKIFCISLFAAYSFFCQSVLAQSATDEACRAFVREPQVEVAVAYGKLKYDFSKNNRSLTRLHIRQYGSVPAGNYVNGLATNDLTTEISFKLNKNTLPNGTVCVYPATIKLKIAMDNPTIYLSKDMDKNSCRYQIALRHEQTHQQINAEALDYYLPLIQKQFVAAVKDFPFISASYDVNLKLAQEQFKDKYLQGVNTLLEEMKNEINNEQSKQDNQTQYDYEQALCK